MDLADLTRDLEALRDDALASIAARRDVAGARGARARRPRQEGPPDDGPARDRRRCRPRTGRGSAPSPTPSAAAIEAALAERGTDLRGSALDGAPRGRGRRRHDARPADPPRRAPPDHRDDARDRRDLRPVRVRRLREPRDRGRPDQLPDAQHPARPPGARPVGHALRRRRGPPAADAHVAGPDPGHARGRSRRSGRCCPGRCFRYEAIDAQPRLGVLPGRGPDGRRGHDDGRPQGPPRPVRQGDVRRRQADPLPARLLPVHGAVGRVRRRVPGLRRLGLPGLLADRLDDDPRRRAWSTRSCSSTAASIRSATRASRSGWAPSGSQDAASTASATCGCSWRTTCASWSSSDESPAVAGCASTSTST